MDVIGFSRGAAAARHFVARRAELQGPWTGGERPAIVINFVGLYDTVSSYEETGTTAGNAFDKLTEGSFDRGLFEDDVKELGLDMHKVPKRVVHLTAADEYRSNFSLTNINTSLAAGVGFELQLPGAHSDVGGGYVEPDPHNPTMDPRKPIRKLNQEMRVVLTESGRQELTAQGWYLPTQFAARYWPETLLESHHIPLLGTTPRVRVRMVGYEAARYLTNQYQYVALFIMLDFAQNGSCRPGGKAHTEMQFESLNIPKYAPYRVPANLVGLRDEFLREAIQLTGSRHLQRVQLLTDAHQFAALAWLRNHYLHRSAHTITEGFDAYLGMDGTINKKRVIIPDDVRADKFSTSAIEQGKRYYHHPDELRRDVKQGTRAAAKSIRQKLDDLHKLF